MSWWIIKRGNQAVGCIEAPSENEALEKYGKQFKEAPAIPGTISAHGVRSVT